MKPPNKAKSAKTKTKTAAKAMAVEKKPAAPDAVQAARKPQPAEVNPLWRTLALGGVRAAAASSGGPPPGDGRASSLNRVAAFNAPQIAGGRPRQLALKRRHGVEADDLVVIGSVRDPAEHEAERVSDNVMSMSPPAPPPIPRESRTSGAGAPLGSDTRQFMEPRFGADLGDVRVHTSPQAAASAERIGARAYTIGRDIVFGEREYSPNTDGGRRLLAHELTHVLQQRGGPSDPATPTAAPDAAPVVRRAGGTLDQRLDREFAEWQQDIDDAEASGNHYENAYARRILLLFQGVDGDTFADEDALDDFIDQAEEDALDEAVTLGRLPEAALRVTVAFPQTWSARVHDALHVDVDTAALAADRTQKQQDMQAVGERVPAEVGDVGLPVPYAEAAGLSEFHLQMRHVNIARAHVVKDMAIAARIYAVAGWVAGFYLVWNAMADGLAQRVADGEVVVNFDDYTEFVDARQQGLRQLGNRIRAVDTEELLTSFDGEVVTLTHAALIQALVSALVGLVPAAFLWEEATRLFDDKLLLVDAAIAAEGNDDKIKRAMKWAWDNSYFGAAGAQLLNAILSHGWQIFAMAAGFIIVQYIPILNVVVDVVVAIYSGQDAVRALYALYQSFGAVAAAQSAVALQSASARMAASMEGDGLRVLLDLLAITAATRGIRTRMDALQRTGLSEEEALRQAMREATGEEAAALRGAAARQRITARFDPDGVLNGVLDSGVSAELVEQALMSGMSPQRLNSIVAGVSDVGRAESIIRYAGNNSSPVNALLDAGMPASRVGELADLGLGLRELSACQIVLARTGQVAQVENFIATLGRIGADGATQLSRLTPEGMASVFQAGGEGALRTVLDTIALEGGGRIVGFGDWVQFTIVNMNKQGADLLNAIGELREAQRIAQTLGAGERVRIGNDLHARGTSSFDMVVEDAAGRAIRNVDVTTATGALESFRDLSNGIRHAIGKARSAAGTGTQEVTIRVTIRPRVSLGRGRFREMNPDGTYRIVESTGASHASGDVLADTATNLPSIGDSNLLNRVNVVNMDGAAIGAIENHGGTWVVVR